MGRIPKLVKERALKELKEQKMKEEAALAEANEGHARESSCSSLSDGNIENYDPNTMETGMQKKTKTCFSILIIILIDSMEDRISPVQRHGDLTHNIEKNNSEQESVLNVSHSSSNSQEKRNTLFKYRTKYPTFLPDDFTVDETDGLVQQTTGLLTNDVFNHVKTISKKLSVNQSSLAVELDENEITFIR